MEHILYTINLVLHILAAVACAAAPFYQLRMVNERGKHDRPGRVDCLGGQSRHVLKV